MCVSKRFEHVVVYKKNKNKTNKTVQWEGSHSDFTYFTCVAFWNIEANMFKII